MHRSRLTCVLLLAVALTVSVSMTSCGGGAGGQDPDLVLVGFNLPNISGIPLNEALIFTFSAPVNPLSITPDTLRVVGTEGPFFETTVVDGNLVALLPRSPNFDTYEDAGLLPDIDYSVSMTVFPAVTTIETLTGKPLLEAEGFTFTTLPFPEFVEPRRPIVHGIPWTLGGESDDAGCLQNSGNTLYESPAVNQAAIQTGSTAGATLLCLQNEGPPRVILTECLPVHNSFSIGTPSAVNIGEIDIPAIRIRFNENLDPLTVTPYTPTTQLPINVQLWRVAQKDGTYVDPPDPIPTNEPVVVQNLDQTEVILVPSKSVPQGLYMVNVTPSVKDLPGNSLRIDDRPDPSLDGFDFYEAQGSFGLNIPPGYRTYFRTLELPSTPLAIIEDFVSNLKEWGDNDSGADEPGVYSSSEPDPFGAPIDFTLDGETMHDQGFGTQPNETLTFVVPDLKGESSGQSTMAAWNVQGTADREDPISDVDGYRFLNIPTLRPNPNPRNPNPGSLQAVYQPWAGSGGDGAFTGTGGGTATWNTDTGSANGDGVYEFESFELPAGETIDVGGSRPLLILCQGDFTLNGTLILHGQDGGPGFDTDGSSDYDMANGSIAAGGLGGAGGPGGGAGGNGGSPNSSPATGTGQDGSPGLTLFDAVSPTSVGEGTPFFNEPTPGNNDGAFGGGGGGFGTDGQPGLDLAGNPHDDGAGGSDSEGGSVFGAPDFGRDIALFEPDRGYHPSANISGGSGGGGGSADDDANGGGSETGDGTAGNGDDAGAGGGGAGGGIWVIARGTITVGNGALVDCSGGDGGNTYAKAAQIIDPGPDGSVGGDEDFLIGAVDDTAPGSGDGGPGGGGAGGAIFLVAREDIDVDAGALLDVSGGAGGSGNAVAGGEGGEGRITLMLFDDSPGAITAPDAAFQPLTARVLFTNPFGWKPTIDLASTAQSEWVDLFTANSLFNQTATGGEPPSFHGNFNYDGDGALQLPVAAGGGGQTLGTDFDAVIEFQGADDVGVLTPGGTHPFSGANGLTGWLDVGLVAPAVGPGAIDNKRYFRWRWRFWAKDGYGTGAGDPADLPLPTVLDFTIPFVKP
jgi:hypothetical protein